MQDWPVLPKGEAGKAGIYMLKSCGSHSNITYDKINDIIAARMLYYRQLNRTHKSSARINCQCHFTQLYQGRHLVTAALMLKICKEISDS